MQILGIYFDAAIVFVTDSSLLFRLALAILCIVKQILEIGFWWKNVVIAASVFKIQNLTFAYLFLGKTNSKRIPNFQSRSAGSHWYFHHDRDEIKEAILSNVSEKQCKWGHQKIRELCKGEIDNQTKVQRLSTKGHQTRTWRLVGPQSWSLKELGKRGK